jgi:glutathione peroxidase
VVSSMLKMFVVAVLLSSWSTGLTAGRADAPSAKSDPASFHGFTVATIDGAQTSLSKWKGKVALVVNTASRCGFTSQYAALQSLWQRYGERGFVVLAFPSNDFGQQEPGSNAEIKRFCELRFNITFPVFAKVAVNGPEASSLYKWLTSQSGLDFKPGPISWNFEKFLVDGTSGKVIGRFAPAVDPLDPKITSRIEAMLRSQASVQ